MKKNYKSYIIIALIAIVIVTLIVLFFYFRKDSISYSTLTATDNSFTIEFPNNIPYQLNNKENNDFVIDLYSKQDEMFFYISRIEKPRMLDLYEIASSDKENYLKDKENIREDSGIIKSNLKDYTSYEYSFIHYDSSYKKDFYSNVIWIETDKNLYIFNFEVVTSNIEKYKNTFLNIKNSFVEL